MRPIIAALLLLCASATFAAPPALVQNCQKLNGGTATQLYTVTIAGSGGTTGCTSNYTAGDLIIVGWGKLSGSDLTTGAISATGATITWHKGHSSENSVFGPPGYWAGIFYACPGDITSPTSSIAITVDMGATMTDFTSINVYEVSNIQNTNCHDSGPDQGQSTPTCNTATNGITTGTASGTLASSVEFIFAVGWQYGAGGCSASPPVTITAGTSGGTSSFGNFTIPSNTNSSCTATTFGQNGCQTYTEYVVVSTNTSGISYATQSPGTLSGVLTSGGFIGFPPNTAGRGPKGKIL